MVNFFPANTWQMMTFLNPLDALIPKIPFSFFADFRPFLGLGHLRGPRSVSVGFWGSLFGGAGPSQGTLSTPPFESPPHFVRQVLLQMR